MLSRLPRWLLISGIALLVALVLAGLVLLIRWMVLSGPWLSYVGWALAGILIVLLGLFLAFSLPQLWKLYKLQKYMKAHESEMRQLPSLMQMGRTQEAMSRFDGMMKNAPDNAFLLYMKARMASMAGKPGEAMSAANKALAMADRDPMLQMMLQQASSQQQGLPSSVKEFKQDLIELKTALEPRLNQMRERHEKAVSKRKKKSR